MRELLLLVGQLVVTPAKLERKSLRRSLIWRIKDNFQPPTRHRKDNPPPLLVALATFDRFGWGEIGELPGLDRDRVAWRSAQDTVVSSDLHPLRRHPTKIQT